jgi:hypothetical protein
MFVGVSPARMHSASCDIIRNVLAILMLMSLCTPTYLVLLHCFYMDSMHTGAAYSSSGNIVPLHIKCLVLQSPGDSSRL